MSQIPEGTGESQSVFYHKDTEAQRAHKENRAPLSDLCAFVVKKGMVLFDFHDP